MVITGDVGSGKTTLLQKLLTELDENVVVAKIFQTQLDEVEFLQAVLVEFGLNPFSAKKVELIDMLNTFMIDQFTRQKQLVLIVDDAHNLSTRVLEEIRMLSGLETRKEKILHIILVGQPELNEKLESPDLQQLLQRVRLRYHLKALTEDDTRTYVAHRLHVAGASRDDIIAPDAIPVIFKYTGGTPRLINTLCDTAMTCGYADGMSQIGEATIHAAIEELQWLPYAKRISKKRLAPAPASADGLREVLEGLSRSIAAMASREQETNNMAPMLMKMNRHLENIEKLLQQRGEAENQQLPTDRKQRGQG